MRIVRQHFATIDSTNAYARAHVSGFDPEAITVITADEQTAGRGRIGRTWVSSGEDIKATFAFRLPAASLANAYQLSPLLSVVARRTLAAAGVDSQIKWPNDVLLAQHKKVGGILAEMESAGDSYWFALGLGLNVNSLPEVLGVSRPVWPLTTLRAETGRTYSVPELTDSLVAHFAAALPQFIAHGFAPFQREYEAASVLLGKRIRFLEGGASVQGTAVKIGEDGKLYLLVDPPATTTSDSDSSAATAAAAASTAASVAPVLRGFLSGEVSSITLVDGTTVSGTPDAKGL